MPQGYPFGISPDVPPGSTTTSPSHSTSASYQELVNSKLPLRPSRMISIMMCSAEVSWQLQEPKASQKSVTQITSQTSLIPTRNNFFRNNKIWFSLVLIRVIQTDFGRSLVRQHDQDHDAQPVNTFYPILVALMTSSRHR